MTETSGTDSAPGGTSATDVSGFVGSEFDPGVWVVGEVGGRVVWVNVESGVVADSLGGAVIDPSEIDGVVEFEELPAGVVGVGPGNVGADRGGGVLHDVEFDPVTGAFVADDQVVGWTAEADGQVGWVEGVGYYHAGTGQWYDTGLNAVGGELADEGRYVSLDDLSPELADRLLVEAGLEGSEVAGGMFFDPVTGSLHSYDPEAWAYDGSTWVNLETGVTADSPTGDETGRYDHDDLETLRQEGEEEAGRTEPEEVSPPITVSEEEDSAPEAESPEPEPAVVEEPEPEEYAGDPPMAEVGEPDPIDVLQHEQADPAEEAPTAEQGEPQPLEIHEPEIAEVTAPEEPTDQEPEVVVAPTENPIADLDESDDVVDGETRTQQEIVEDAQEERERQRLAEEAAARVEGAQTDADSQVELAAAAQALAHAGPVADTSDRFIEDPVAVDPESDAGSVEARAEPDGETPNAEEFEPDLEEPVVVVAPTEVPTVEVFESESESEVVEEPGVSFVGKVSEVPVGGVDVPVLEEPVVVVAPTEVPTVEVYEPRADAGDLPSKGFDTTEVGDFGSGAARVMPTEMNPADAAPDDPDPGGGEREKADISSQGGAPAFRELAEGTERVTMEGIDGFGSGAASAAEASVESGEQHEIPIEVDDPTSAGLEAPIIEDMPAIFRDAVPIEFLAPIEELEDEPSILPDIEFEPLEKIEIEPIRSITRPDIEGEDLLDD